MKQNLLNIHSSFLYTIITLTCFDNFFNSQLNKSMFDHFCSLFSSMAQPGQYAYQAFKKVPQLNVLIQATTMLSNMKQQNMIQNIGTVVNVAGMVGNTFGINPLNFIGGNGNNNNSQIQQSNLNIGSIACIIGQFINNVPQDSIKANQSNLNKIIATNQDSVIKQILKSNYAQLIKTHQQQKCLFTDPDFPPIQKSIGEVDGTVVNCTWKRISQVIKNPQFIQGKIQPGDILQGSIGDCYFLSAIAALAEFDFRIKNLFADLKVNQYGIYMARILYQGKIVQVVVDDYIPVNAQGQPLFAKPAAGNQIWVMILEKCWAKLHGSYGAIVGGLPNQVLHAFSGAPTYYRPVPQNNKEKQQILWKEIFQAHENGAILCCGTKGQPSVQKAGLVLGHAYTIIDVYSSPYRLLKIRNPWGKKEWNGRASEEDSQFWANISPQDKQRMNYVKGQDGTFFMLWEDFVNYFDMVDICKIKDNASYMNVDAQFDKKRGQVFEFKTTGGDVTLALSQQSLRGFGETEEKRGYARSTLIVARHDQASTGFEYKYVDSSSSKLFSEHYLELKSLPAGQYVIFAKVDCLRKQAQPSSLSIYTESSSSLVKSSQSSHKQLLFKTFLDHARKNPKKQTLSQNSPNQRDPQEWICSELLLNKSGYGYLAIHLDEKSTKKIGIQINEKDYVQRRLTLKKPYKGQGVIKTMVQPGKQLIVLFKLKAHNFPATITLPTPKIFNLV